MPVKLKPSICKRLASQFCITCDELRKAEEKCDAQLFLSPNNKGVFEGFYLLHVPVKGKIAPTFFPLYYFVGHAEHQDKQNETSLKDRTGELLCRRGNR